MELLPSLDLLRETHEFPGPYMFKAIGLSESGFAARVVAAVRSELSLDEDPPHKLQATAGGRHVSVTLEPILESPAQVLAIYRRLQETAGLRFLF